MRTFRFLAALLILTLVGSVVPVGPGPAFADSVDEADQAVHEAEQRAEVATGLVNEAVTNRLAIETQLAEAIARLNDLAAQLSAVGIQLDKTASQLAFVDLEMTGIQSAIEVQAVDAYMSVLGAPTVTLVNSSSVEEALVVGTVVDSVVGAGREVIAELLSKRRSLEQLQEVYLSQEAQYQSLQDEMAAEVDHIAELYEQAEEAVAAAVREAQEADAAYRAALDDLERARIQEEQRRREEERRREAERRAATTTTTGGGSGRTWNHPPEVERWRPLVERFFPASRVEEALRIMDCESNGDPEAYNPYSGASGLFQFIPSTWATTAPKAGYPDASPFEPEANTASAAWLANRYEQLGLYYWLAWSCRRVLN
ncbi:MAG: transglycosylase SLT domain-containing protein [Acidimicrobiia bacterium]